MLDLIRGVRVPWLFSRPRPPARRAENAVLRSEAEWRAACAEAASLGLSRHPDPSKTWDSLIALDVVLRNVPPGGRILDAGAERYSVLLPWLAAFGYQHLFGINLVFDKVRRRGPIEYRPGDLTRTGLHAESFDAITCLSVIEHGVDIDAYLTEAARLLRPGGVLMTSVDYWPDPVDTGGQQAYGVPIRIFTRADLRDIIKRAEAYGLVPSSPIADDAFDGQQRAVSWRRFGLTYTFAAFTLRKQA
jgi:SAM-dependent methyltransferase